MDSIIFSTRLNETRKNLTANPERSPLMREPRSKTYGDHWLTAQSGVKARLRRHASACQEVATPDPDCAVSPEGRALKHASAALQPLPRVATIGFGLRLAATCFRARRGPIGLAPRLPHQGGSSRIGSQIFPGFVQANTVKTKYTFNRYSSSLNQKLMSLGAPPSCNMQASYIPG